MPTYTVDDKASRVVVKARSSVHDTNAVWNRVEGTITADPERLVAEGATATFNVDMTAYDAGDFLKNRKLKKDLDVDRYPRAVFALERLEGVTRDDNGAFRAKAIGTMSWHDHKVAITIDGTGTVTDDQIRASGSFDLDITTLGVQPPKILMFKVDKDVTVDVTFVARVR